MRKLYVYVCLYVYRLFCVYCMCVSLYLLHAESQKYPLFYESEDSFIKWGHFSWSSQL